MVYKPLISIITPTYNHEKYIAECIESALCQTYENWEMIVIDDASTDKTPEIIEEYIKKDKRIKMIKHKENYGPYYLDKTYNEALNMAKGEWVAILEGDDVWMPYKLEKQIEVLDNNFKDNIVLFCGKSGFIYEDLNLITVPNVRVTLVEKYLPKNKPFNPIKFLIFGYNLVSAVTALIKKEALREIGGFIQKPREIMLVDFPTWLRLGLIGNFYFDDTILGFWRRHFKSITMNNQEIIAINYQKAVDIFLSETGNLEFEITDKDCLGILNFFGAIYSAILREDWEKANFFYQKLYYCVKKGSLSIDKILKFKLLISRISIFLKNKHILELAFKLKRKNIDKKVCNYFPFFFKDPNLISTLQKEK